MRLDQISEVQSNSKIESQIDLGFFYTFAQRKSEAEVRLKWCGGGGDGTLTVQ